MIPVSFTDALSWEGSSSSRAIHTWQIDIVTDNSLPSKCIWEHKAHINIVEHIPLTVIHFCPSASCSPERKIISLGVICLTDTAGTKLFPFASNGLCWECQTQVCSTNKQCETAEARHAQTGEKAWTACSGVPTLKKFQEEAWRPTWCFFLLQFHSWPACLPNLSPYQRIVSKQQGFHAVLVAFQPRNSHLVLCYGFTTPTWAPLSLWQLSDWMAWKEL